MPCTSLSLLFFQQLVFTSVGKVLNCFIFQSHLWNRIFALNLLLVDTDDSLLSFVPMICCLSTTPMALLATCLAHCDDGCMLFLHCRSDDRHCQKIPRTILYLLIESLHICTFNVILGPEYGSTVILINWVYFLEYISFSDNIFHSFPKLPVFSSSWKMILPLTLLCDYWLFLQLCMYLHCPWEIDECTVI